MLDECAHRFAKFKRFFFFGCDSLELLRQTEDDCNDATAMGSSENGGQKGKLIGVSSILGAGAEVLGGALRGPVEGMGDGDALGGVRVNTLGNTRFAPGMQKIGKSVRLGYQLALGGEDDDESLGVLFERPVSDGVGQREASEIGVVEEDVVCVPRQVPYGLCGGRCPTAQEAMGSRDHERLLSGEHRCRASKRRLAQMRSLSSK